MKQADDDGTEEEEEQKLFCAAGFGAASLLSVSVRALLFLAALAVRGQLPTHKKGNGGAHQARKERAEPPQRNDVVHSVVVVDDDANRSICESKEKTFIAPSACAASLIVVCLYLGPS